jgi:hypothetical protein
MVDSEVKKQYEQFYNKLKQKQLRKTRYKRKKQNSNLDEIANEFIKKFQYIYYSRIVSKPMQVCVNLYSDLYTEKLKISNEFDPQIKEFELLHLHEDSK